MSKGSSTDGDPNREKNLLYNILARVISSEG